VRGGQGKAAADKPASDKPQAAGGGEMDELKRQLDELQKRLDKIGGKE
jgi:hypothetical protein